MNMGDRNYEMYVEKKNARAEGHAEGKSDGHADAINVMRAMNLPAEQIAEVQARLAALSSK